MRLVCAESGFAFPADDEALNVILYGQAHNASRGSAGDAVRYDILRAGLLAEPRAWDLLTIALSVITADFANLRERSPDGWTREFDLQVAVAEPEFWTTQIRSLEDALRFLTTDIWHLTFLQGGAVPNNPRHIVEPDEDCVTLLSGGLDSLIGAIDLVEDGRKPIVVSHSVRGDVSKQAEFAQTVGGGLRHIQVNPNAQTPGTREPSQRARSLIFISLGVLAATSLKRYRSGERITMFLCENGFIAMNPALTAARVGSLSTRTAHPEFITRIQLILDAAMLNVNIENPYSLHTKGEMMVNCRDQATLGVEAASSTSCGRFQRYGYRQCGRCIPCQVRRGAFLTWGAPDQTQYVYEDLGRDDPQYAGFDDVRAVAMALAKINEDGFDSWLGASLSLPNITNAASLRSVIERGVSELRELHRRYNVT